MKSPKNKVTIAGAGLAGSYLACLLIKDGYEVEIFERRSDMRKQGAAGGRSINLAISKRGLDALDAIGVKGQLSSKLIPMQGRQIHHKSGEESFQIYGAMQGEGINSVSRSGLNSLLMDQAESLGVKIYFDSPVGHVDLDEKKITLEKSGGSEVLSYDKIIGTDGSGSAVRDALCSKLADFKVDMLPYGYKELTIPPLADGGFAIKKQALHIWPRKKFMLIGLPNPDGSFTGTLFLPLKGDVSFESLSDTDAFEEFFKTEFVDALSLMPKLREEYKQNPIGSLGTIRLSPWYFQDHAILLGDAAHGIVPFYGQGMNCAFESCQEFVAALNKSENKWSQCLPEFMEQRKPHSDAIATLALNNFEEMKDHVADKSFLLKKEVLKRLEERIEGFQTEYSLVTFTNTPYAVALKEGIKQRELVESATAGVESFDELDWDQIDTLALDYVHNMNAEGTQ